LIYNSGFGIGNDAMTLFGYKITRSSWMTQSVSTPGKTSGPATLIDIRPGQRAQLRGFAPGLSAERFAHLQAYGLTPGRWIRVLQHAPVTVIQVEHCEIALEADLARLVEVSIPE
jgi:hypothetical protein